MTTPETILHSGTVLTLDGAGRTATALALHGDRITAVGDSAALRATAGPRTRQVDLAGRTVMPGFFDAHAHMDREGLKRCAGDPIGHCRSIAEIQQVVAAAVARRKPGEWVLLLPMGAPPHGYLSRPDQLEDGRFPDRHDLDKVSPDNPVYIRAPWGWWSRPPFPSVANSAALARAGITRDTRAPFRTEILHDAQGEPTGVFLERNFTPILEYTLFRCVPRFTEADRAASVALGAAAYAEAGTTAIYEGHGVTPALLTAFRETRARDGLPLRATLPLSVPTAAFDDDRIEALLMHWADRLGGAGWGDDRLRAEGLCLDVGDPDLARIIAGHYPYEQWAGHFYQSLPQDRLVTIGEIAARLGMRVNCLVCYDLERVLSAYEEIDRRVSIRDRRWTVVHVVDATDAQIERMARLGVIATVTPNFMFMARDRFGIDRLRERAIPIRRLMDAGVPVALSSDGVPYSMLWTMWEALARWDDDSQSRLGDSGLSRDEALRIAAQSGHLLNFAEDRLGVLEPGRAADFVVLDDNPMTCDEAKLPDIPVHASYVAGRQVAGAGVG